MSVLTGWIDVWCPPQARTRLLKSHRFRGAAAVVGVWVLAALAAGLWGRSGGPVGETLLGARTAALAVGGVLLIAVPLGGATGLLAGAGSRVADTLLARLIELGGLLPTVVLLAVAQAAEPVPTLGTFIVIVGLTRALRMARLVRGEALRVSHATHVMAARALGVSRRRVLAFHVLPLTTGPLLVEGAFTAAAVVGLEAALSLVGLGLPSDSASWGTQLGTHSGLSAALPAAAVALVTSALVALADSLDDAANPRRSFDASRSRTRTGPPTEEKTRRKPVTPRQPGTK